MMIRFGNTPNTATTTPPTQANPIASQTQIAKPSWIDHQDEDLVTLMLKKHEEAEKTFDQLEAKQPQAKKTLKGLVNRYILRQKAPTAQEREEQQLAIAEQHFQAAKTSADADKELFRRRNIATENTAVTETKA
jgi:hypothetical protein